MRIILILIVTGSFLTCLATVFVYFATSNYLRGQNDINIIQFEEKLIKQNPLKRLHIAIHANGNELFDFHLQENLNFSWSMQIPQQSSPILFQNPPAYFSFEHKRKIHIIYGNKKSETTLVTSSDYHRTILNSQVPRRCGIHTFQVRIGHYIWLLGGSEGPFPADGLKSMLWSLKRQTWIEKGPAWPNLDEPRRVIGGCALAMNRSNVIIFGKSYNNYGYHGFSAKLIYSLYDFDSQKWTNSEPGVISLSLFDITCEANFSKDNQMLIYILFDLDEPGEEIQLNVFNPKDYSLQKESFPIYHGVGKLVSFKGILHYFCASSSALHFFKLNQDWIHLETISNLNFSKINNVIPYTQSYCPETDLC